MRYVSTRGGVAQLSFCEAVMMGLASDGGLLVPESIPDVSKDLASLKGSDYTAIAEFVMGKFIDDIQPEQLKEIIRRSYATFDDPLVTPLVKVGELYVLELFHGPTLAFKDFALQLLARLFDHVLERRGERVQIETTTSIVRVVGTRFSVSYEASGATLVIGPLRLEGGSGAPASVLAFVP